MWCYGSTPGGEPHRQLGTTDTSGKLQYRGLPLREVWARVAGSEPSQQHELPPYRAEEVPVEPIAVRLELGPAGCTLAGANLTKADLRGAGLQGAILNGANLSGANLDQVDLRGALGITASQVCSAGKRNEMQLDEMLLQEVLMQCGPSR